MNDTRQTLPDGLREAWETGWGRVEEYVPGDSRVHAVLGHPLHHALTALWEGEQNGAFPLEALVRTARAYAGEYFHALEVRPPRLLPEQAYRFDLEQALEGNGFQMARTAGLDFLRMLSSRYGEPEFQLWVQAPYPPEQVVRAYDHWLTEIRYWGGLKPDPTGGTLEVSEPRESAARLLSTVAMAIRNVEIWDLEEQAKTFSGGVREDSWGEIREIAGQASTRGRTAHPKVLEYWKETRKQISGLIKERRSEETQSDYRWWQLWKRERELVDSGNLRDFTPAEVGALFLWLRAGRLKKLVTFARHMGVNLKKSTAEEMVGRVEE